MWKQSMEQACHSYTVYGFCNAAWTLRGLAHAPCILHSEVA